MNRTALKEKLSTGPRHSVNHGATKSVIYGVNLLPECVPRSESLGRATMNRNEPYGRRRIEMFT